MTMRILFFVIIAIAMIYVGLFLMKGKASAHAEQTLPNPSTFNLADGVQTQYWRMEGKASPVSFIFLAGGPGRRIGPGEARRAYRLSAEHTVYLFEQVGNGYSTRLDRDGYTVDYQLTALSQFISAKAPNGVVLIGESWGAILATRYAQKFPDQVRGLVLLSPGPLELEERPTAKLSFHPGHVARALSERSPDAAAWIFPKGGRHTYDIDGVNLEANLWLAEDHFRTWRDWLDKPVSSPALLIGGSKDQISRAPYARTIEDVTEIIVDGGHSIDPEQCAVVLPVSRFIAKISDQVPPTSCVAEKPSSKPASNAGVPVPTFASRGGER